MGMGIFSGMGIFGKLWDGDIFRKFKAVSFSKFIALCEGQTREGSFPTVASILLESSFRASPEPAPQAGFELAKHEAA